MPPLLQRRLRGRSGPRLASLQAIRTPHGFEHSEDPEKSPGSATLSCGHNLFFANGMGQRDEPPLKLSKLAIAAETEEDRYEITTSVICYSCSGAVVDKTSGNLPAVIEGVMTAMTFSKREEVKAWEQEFIPCEHTLCLTQNQVENSEAKGMRISMCYTAMDSMAHLIQILANARHAT